MEAGAPPAGREGSSQRHAPRPPGPPRSSAPAPGAEPGLEPRGAQRGCGLDPSPPPASPNPGEKLTRGHERRAHGARHQDSSGEDGEIRESPRSHRRVPSPSPRGRRVPGSGRPRSSVAGGRADWRSSAPARGEPRPGPAPPAPPTWAPPCVSAPGRGLRLLRARPPRDPAPEPAHRGLAPPLACLFSVCSPLQRPDSERPRPLFPAHGVPAPPPLASPASFPEPGFTATARVEGCAGAQGRG